MEDAEPDRAAGMSRPRLEADIFREFHTLFVSKTTELNLKGALTRCTSVSPTEAFSEGCPRASGHPLISTDGVTSFSIANGWYLPVNLWAVVHRSLQAFSYSAQVTLAAWTSVALR